jgi:hypothetical protein
MKGKTKIIAAVIFAVVLLGGGVYAATTGDLLQGEFTRGPAIEADYDMSVDYTFAECNADSCDVLIKLEDIHDDIGEAADVRTTCDLSDDTSVANVRECVEDMWVEQKNIADGNFNMIYDEVKKIRDELTSSTVSLLDVMNAIEDLENEVEKLQEVIEELE